jgi:hypothetical protein
MRVRSFRMVIWSGSVFLSSLEVHSPAPENILHYLLRMVAPREQQKHLASRPCLPVQGLAIL